MKIKELLNTYYESSSTASSLSRQLAFAGIAIIWIFRVGEQSGGIQFSEELLLPLYCLIAGLTFDLVQYIYKSIIWASLNYYHWNKYKDNEIEVEISGWFNVPTNIFFWGKIILVAIGYFQLLYNIRAQL